MLTNKQIIRDLQVELEKVQTKQRINNNLAGAVLGTSNLDVTVQRASRSSQQINEVETLFRSTRWYEISRFRGLLSQIYAELGIVQTFIDVPVEDALSGEIKIHTDQISTEEIQDLQGYMEMKKDVPMVGQAAKWNRLFGGSGILIVTDYDFQRPFDLELVNKGDQIEFKAVDLWELYGDYLLSNKDDRQIDPSEIYEHQEFFTYYTHTVHNSRILRMKGIPAPSFIRPRLRGWGLSVLDGVIRSINKYLKSSEAVFEMLDEFKIDVYKLKDLAEMASMEGGEARVMKRLMIANESKNLHSAIVLDSEDEYDQKEIRFQGLEGVMKEIRAQLASELRIPQVKLFGVNYSGGFDKGGAEIENYNRMIEASIRSEIKQPLMTVIKIRCMELFGVVPEDLEIEFEPLIIMSEEQLENIKNFQFQRLLQARQAGEISSKEFKDSCNNSKMFPIDVKVNDENYLPDDPLEREALEMATAPTPKGPTEGAV